MKVRVVYKPDSTVAVVHPAPKSRKEWKTVLRREVDDQTGEVTLVPVEVLLPEKFRRLNMADRVEADDVWLARVLGKPLEPRYVRGGGGELVQANPLHGLEFDDLEDSEIPQTKQYREAWRGQKGVGVTLDAAKVAEIDAREKLPTYAELAERLKALEAKEVLVEPK